MSKTIKVAQIVGKMVGGGVESFVMNYYKHIDRNKIQFDFIVDEDSTNIPLEEIEELGGNVIIVPPYQKIFRYIITLIKVFKRNDYQIIHSHINTLSVFPLFAAKLCNVPVRIAHSHSTTSKKEYKRNIVKNILKRFSKLFSTHYFACSLNAGEWMFGKSFFKCNGVIINNAIDTSIFKYNEKIRKKIRKELKIEDSQKVVGHVGRLVETKNQLQLIDLFENALKIRKDMVLMLVGEGPLRKKIEKTIADKNLQTKVKLIGVKNNVNEYMMAMDVFVFPSLYEGFGMAVIEAQAAGLPCIVSNNVPREVKRTDLVWFCDFSNRKSDIINKIIEFENFERAENDFNELEIKREVKKLEKIYLNLI